jgi:hypothetical protein
LGGERLDNKKAKFALGAVRVSCVQNEMDTRKNKNNKKDFSFKKFEIKMMNLLNLSLYGLCKKKFSNLQLCSIAKRAINFDVVIFKFCLILW